MTYKDLNLFIETEQNCNIDLHLYNINSGLTVLLFSILYASQQIKKNYISFYNTQKSLSRKSKTLSPLTI